ncbi:uncharacterized protein LOC131651479 [Vicia villosa]|uniref:uncharacterized protein LOC131651479 n=1 Tax=Vicia villosa TaxID=3911 RepID=UPI00273AE958|nr:uncharacterized protein LOC131651479 [Vicia villosa]
MLAFELVRGYNRKGGTPRSMLQIDLQKAYDMVDWSSLETVLKELGFPMKFINWIMLGTSTVSYRFNVNGEYTQKMTKNTDFRFHSKCQKLRLTHLTFADDVLLFSRGDDTSLRKMLIAFNSFSESTGLVVNPNKCKAFYGGMDTNMKNQAGIITGFAEQ